MYELPKRRFTSVADGTSRDSCLIFLLFNFLSRCDRFSLKISHSHSKQVISCLRRLVLLDEAKYQFVSEGGVQLLFDVLQKQGLLLCATILLTNDSRS